MASRITNFFDRFQLDGGDIVAIGSSAYGVCETSSNVAAKTVEMDGFALHEGATIHVKFVYSNSALATLNVNNTGAYAIVFAGRENIEPAAWSAGAVLQLTFDGVNWLTEVTLASVEDGIEAVTEVLYDANTRILSYIFNNGNPIPLFTLGTMAFAQQADFISKDVIANAYDMLYALDSTTIGRLPANTTTTKKFLRTMGVEQTQEVDGETISEIVPTAPEWDEITAADIGLENVTNHKQVTDVLYNSSTGALTVTKGDDPPITLFNLGSNAFDSTAYLPINGGEMTGTLEFSSTAPTIVWNNEHKSQRIYVLESVASDNPVFLFQQEAAGDWTTLLTIRANGEVVANKFIGALQGNADSASALQHVTLTSATIDESVGTFAFSGAGLPWENTNWTGIQIGDDNLKFQMADNNSNIMLRANNGTTWSAWSPLLTESMITSGDNNGQIKVGDTNINVTGLGALAYMDTLDTEALPDLSTVYVTLNTPQTITGTKIFDSIEILPPTSTEAKGIIFNGNLGLASLQYNEAQEEGHLRLNLSNIPFHINFNTNDIFTFTDKELVVNPIAIGASTYDTLTIRPGVTNQGTLGTSTYRWAQIYAQEFYGSLKGNADTATNALNDSTGAPINTSYLKLSGGIMTGTITTRSPINQIIEGGIAYEAVDSGSAASPNRYKPTRWSFGANLVPSNGDIITIKTPSPGHDYGVYLSMDSGAHYYPITLNNGDRLIDQYPSSSYLTLIFDSTNSAYNIFTVNGSDTRIIVNGGTWRVINYYDSGAPYGVRVYKTGSNLDRELPILVSQASYNDISAPFTNNIYAILSTNEANVPTINPLTGVITAKGFNGPMQGIATTALEFENPTTVTLTGVVTGVSAPSTIGWVVPTTIAENTITNEMLLGGISATKLDNTVVKVFSRTDTANITNLDTIAINGFFPLRSYQEISSLTGSRPFDTEGIYLNINTPDNRAKFQFAGNGTSWMVRGVSGTNASLDLVDWRTLITEDVPGSTNRPWNITITGAADSATKDADGNVITTHYATNTRVSELLAAADALVFKGLIDSSAAFDDDGRKTYRNVPTQGYQAGWTYKVIYEDRYVGQLCEEGDLIIAINDGPITGNQIIPSDWVVVQANLERAISGNGSLVTPNAFAIFDTVSGKVIRDTGTYLLSLDHAEALAGANKRGNWDGLRITGLTSTIADDMVSGVADVMSFGDAGPQIQFVDDATYGAIIYNSHLNNSGMTAAYNFVTAGGYTALKADGLIAKSKIIIGSEVVDSNNALKVSGQSTFQGKIFIQDSTVQHSLSLDFLDNKCIFNTQDELVFTNVVNVGGNIYPTTNNFYTLGSNDAQNPLTWHAVYIGANTTYGSGTYHQPIYWNEGVPTPITYTTNRLYYAPSEGIGFDPGSAYMPANHYIDMTKLAINYSQGAPQETLYVNGDVRIIGSLAQNGHIMPSIDANSDLGSSDRHWAHVYVGTADSYGDPYTPVYWHGGVPEIASIIQKASFEMTATDNYCIIHSAAYAENTIVIQIVITEGKQNLTAPIKWKAENNQVTLSMKTNPLGPVNGYIITARGTDLD